MEQKIPIFWVRGLPVILDLHLASLYGVKTKRLNEQVGRNVERFPEDFVFRLSKKEWGEVVANCDHLGKSLFSNTLPTAFTEQGALMASTVLRSAQAIQMSIYIVRAFVRMREAMSANEAILRRLAEIDKTLLVHDEGLRDLYQKLMPLLKPGPEPERRKIGFQAREKDEDEDEDEVASRSRARAVRPPQTCPAHSSLSLRERINVRLRGGIGITAPTK